MSKQMEIASVSIKSRITCITFSILSIRTSLKTRMNRKVLKLFDTSLAVPAVSDSIEIMNQSKPTMGKSKKNHVRKYRRAMRPGAITMYFFSWNPVMKEAKISRLQKVMVTRPMKRRKSVSGGSNACTKGMTKTSQHNKLMPAMSHDKRFIEKGCTMRRWMHVVPRITCSCSSERKARLPPCDPAPVDRKLKMCELLLRIMGDSSCAHVSVR
mmetsp:Transcript_31747/g.91452  ORF Transcript_31747/g.91452 Transcript_31747/m.91452 type:complete len:212 (+) Transcript_31747:1264-1899(+)